MIEEQVSTVWKSSLTNRRYLSKRACVYAEAKALIYSRHPIEPYEHDTGGGYDIACEEPERFIKTQRRLARLIQRSIKSAGVGKQ